MFNFCFVSVNRFSVRLGFSFLLAYPYHLATIPVQKASFVYICFVIKNSKKKTITQKKGKERKQERGVMSSNL